MKVNTTILSLPPHISTAWKNVTSLQVVREGDTSILAVILLDGHVVKIPGLSQEILQHIFSCHAAFLEEQATSFPKSSLPDNLPLNKMENFIDIPLQFTGNGFQGFGPLQHNPEQAASPDMPPEVLSKIVQVATAFSNVLGGEEGTMTLPDAEPHCNCMHCQIVRAMKGEVKAIKEKEEEEPVTEQDLKFKEFEIQKVGDNLYEVTNPLDQTEHFQVFLGTPIGCTCGNKNCDHIKAVLNS